MKDILEIDSVIIEYGLERILQDVYLKIETGRITGLLGRNGSGKSSLMKIIFGKLNPSSKSLRINNKEILGIKRDPSVIKYLPQHHFIPKSLTVDQVLKDFDLEFHKLIEDFPSFENKRKAKVKSLSGGQRRILEIYSILVSTTKFCLLDEPFSQIMPISIEQVKNLVTREKQNKAILLTDHMYNHILEICDDLYVINKGKTNLTKDHKDLERLGYINGQD